MFSLHIVSMITVLIFSIYQVVYILLNSNTSLFLKLIASIVLVATVQLGIHHTTYLPFLGTMAIPPTVLKEETEKPAGTITVPITVDAPDGTKVVYWASNKSSKVFDTPAEAYSGFKNSGVAIVKDKKVSFYVECPSSYKVPYGMTLKPHIHYRVATVKGLLGEVKTVHVECP